MIRKSLAALALVSLASASALASGLTQAERDYFSVADVSVVEDHSLDLGDVSMPLDTESFQDEIVILEKIINIGEKVWAFIEKNKPVVNVALHTATATPAGIHRWDSLAGWQTPVARGYRITYTNYYGMKVVDFGFRVVYTYGGSYKGKGRYLAQATVVPAELSVAWGYTFNANVEVPAVTNAGTMENPIGAAQIQVSWSVDTVMKHWQQTENFYMRGDGYFQKL